MNEHLTLSHESYNDNVVVCEEHAWELASTCTRQVIVDNIEYLKTRLNESSVICDNNLRIKHKMVLADYMAAFTMF